MCSILLRYIYYEMRISFIIKKITSFYVCYIFNIAKRGCVPVTATGMEYK